MLLHHKISLRTVGLSLSHKTCFLNFSVLIPHGKRIAIIGPNGSGKSTLLQIIQGLVEPSQGRVIIPDDVVIGYVPQIVQEHETLSGGQRLNKALTQALSKDPNVLCLDEPTNHLDHDNRRSFMRMLKAYKGTLILVTHDVELLRTRLDEIWIIEHGKIKIFSGDYHAYLEEKKIAEEAQQEQLAALQKDKKKARAALQKEQQRAARSKQANQHENDKNLLGTMRESGDKTAGKNRGKINELSQKIDADLQALQIAEVINPRFKLKPADLAKTKSLVAISDGSCGYAEPILSKINLQISPTTRIGILGGNGSGKSTLVKAIFGDENIVKTGEWHCLKKHEIGYLDQHYQTLDPESTAFEIVEQEAFALDLNGIRKHLNNFLFRKNEEVKAKVKTLSGGEKARLSLAQIAARNPKLVILDEMTNNVDLATREHIIQVLAAYPGAVLVISHDQDFLKRINVTSFYEIKEGNLCPVTS